MPGELAMAGRWKGRKHNYPVHPVDPVKKITYGGI